MSDHEDREREDEGILDSVRRILAHDAAREADRKNERADEVFELDQNMIVGDPPPSASPPHLEPQPPSTAERFEPRPATASPTAQAVASSAAGADTLLGERAGRSAGSSLASLRQAVRERATVATHRSGPTIEDIIREELRPLLRDWLDQHLPATVEKLVRHEIERIVSREL